MKLFLFKLSLLAILLVTTYAFFLHKLALGEVDDYYYKFTQNAEHIIVGLSRANNGISPKILHEELSNPDWTMGISNFAFEKYQSAYGLTYLDAIRQKLTYKKINTLSIVCVTPGSLTAPIGMDSESIVTMDQKTILGKVTDFTSYPNYNYIINCYGESLYKVLIPEENDNQTTLHPDGWREFKLRSRFYNVKAKDIAHWKAITLAIHSQGVSTEEKSNYRINSLVSTLKYLKSRGDVFLIRMPADSDIIAMENKQWAYFDSFIDSIAKVEEIKFLNYTKAGHSFETYDGSHLHSKSAQEFSRILAQDIMNHKKNGS